jgi:hypothetical protein
MVATRTSFLQRGVIAGLAGGLAEVIWVGVYSEATGGNAAQIASAVTTAAGLNALLPSMPVTMGIAVHMLLAVALGIALAFAWQWLAVRARGTAVPYLFVLAALVGVWTMNFFVILPLLSPAFITLLPYAVSLASKLLFGLAAAETLRRLSAPAVARATA